MPLFERLPTGVVVTKPGEVLARRVKLMELEYLHAMSEINALEQGLTGTLRIAAGPMWVTVILPDVLSAFHRQFPKVKVRVTEGAIDSIVPALMAGEIDRLCDALLSVATGIDQGASCRSSPRVGGSSKAPARGQGDRKSGGLGALSMGRTCQ